RRGRNPEVLAGVVWVEWIPDRRREHSLFPNGLRHGAEADGGRGVAQTLVVAENECLVFDNRAAERAAELVALAEWFTEGCLVREEIAGVEPAVAQEVVRGAVQLVGARADHRIH